MSCVGFYARFHEQTLPGTGGVWWHQGEQVHICYTLQHFPTTIRNND